MFAVRLRNAFLALAGAAIIASTLMTGVASADATDNVPLPNGGPGVTPKPHFTLPVTDIEVKRIAQGGSGAPGERAFATFRVKNIGSDAMTFDVTSSWSKRRIADDTYYPVTNKETVSMQPGQSKDVTMSCNVPNTQYECYYFVVTVNHFLGIDQNISNNGAAYDLG